MSQVASEAEIAEIKNLFETAKETTVCADNYAIWSYLLVKEARQLSSAFSQVSVDFLTGYFDVDNVDNILTCDVSKLDTGGKNKLHIMRFRCGAFVQQADHYKEQVKELKGWMEFRDAIAELNNRIADALQDDEAPRFSTGGIQATPTSLPVRSAKRSPSPPVMDEVSLAKTRKTSHSPGSGNQSADQMSFPQQTTGPSGGSISGQSGSIETKPQSDLLPQTKNGRRGSMDSVASDKTQAGDGGAKTQNSGATSDTGSLEPRGAQPHDEAGPKR